MCNHRLSSGPFSVRWCSMVLYAGNEVIDQLHTLVFIVRLCHQNTFFVWQFCYMCGRPSSFPKSKVDFFIRRNCKQTEKRTYNITSQQTHDVYTTSPQRRCNVKTLHRRWDDFVKTSCARWDVSWLHSARQEECRLIYCLCCRGFFSKLKLKLK